MSLRISNYYCTLTSINSGASLLLPACSANGLTIRRTTQWYYLLVFYIHMHNRVCLKFFEMLLTEGVDNAEREIPDFKLFNLDDFNGMRRDPGLGRRFQIDHCGTQRQHHLSLQDELELIQDTKQVPLGLSQCH